MGFFMGFHGEEPLTSLVWHNVNSWANMNNYSMMIVDHPHIGYINQPTKKSAWLDEPNWIHMDLELN